MVKKRSQTYAFEYKAGNSLLHRCPALVKILLLPLLSVLIFALPFYFALALLLFQLILALCLRFSFRELLSDLKIVLWYVIMLLFVKFAAFGIKVLVEWGQTSQFQASQLQPSQPQLFIDQATLIMLLRLFSTMLLASLFFRTSSSLELRSAFESLELGLRRGLHLKLKTPVAEALSLFVCFIPLVSKNWKQAERAWFVRGGKNSIKKYLVLLPVFFSVGMKEAYNLARALSIRSLSESERRESE